MPEGQGMYDSRSPYQEWDWSLNGYDHYSGFECGGRGLLRCDETLRGKGEAFKANDCNLVPFNRAWNLETDRETGMVATRLWEEQPMGSEAWVGRNQPILADGFHPLEKTPAWFLPYQVGAYYGWRPKSTWQTTQGLGSRIVKAMGKAWTGWPRYSYSVWLVQGRASKGRAAELVREAEELRWCRFRASTGSVATQAPRGIADPVEETLAVPGLDTQRGA
jgi:hypothetical protein